MCNLVTKGGVEVKPVELSGLTVYVGSKTLPVFAQSIILHCTDGKWTIAAFGLNPLSAGAFRPWIEEGSSVSISAVTADGRALSVSGFVNQLDPNFLQLRLLEAPPWEQGQKG